MKITHNSLLLAVSAGCAMFLAGCALEPYELPNEELYVRGFIKKYGLPDVDHTWSMAASVKASVDVEGLKEGTVEVFTDYPGSPEARLVARLPINGGSAKASLPLRAGTQSVYLRVKDQDNTIRSVSRMAVENNTLNVNLTAMATPGDDKLPTVEDLELSAYVMDEMTRNYYHMFLDELSTQEERDNYTYVECLQRYKNDSSLFYYPNPDNLYYKVEELPSNRPLTPIPNLKMLENMYYEMGPALSYRNVLAPIFDKYTYTDPETGETTEAGGVFQEGENNLERYYHKAKTFDPDVTFRVREEGPVTMQCIWGGTQLNDYFGYYYYVEGEEPSTEDLWNLMPKYVFLTPDDITAESDLTQMKKEGEDWKNLNGMGVADASSWTDDPSIRGRKYYLAYYGEEYDEEPSYIFPDNIKIGYFLYKADGNLIFFSDCRTEYELCRRDYAPNNSTVSGEGPLMRPFAAKFRMQNRTYVGFGDECGDCDLNDIVFIAENVYPDPEDITPPELKEEDPDIPDTPVSPNAQTWTLACEDLGSTDDTDFNDIVLDVAYVAGETKLTITPRAAGGTLVSKIYFREGDNSDYTELGEIHNLMSSEYSGIPSMGYAMLNTGDSPQVNPKSVKPITVTVPADFDFASDFLKRIKITTRQYDEKDYEAKEITAFTDVAESGKIPQMILLEGGWYWPTERTAISEAYPDFKDWVKNHNNYEWTKNRVKGNAVSHRGK